MHHGKNQPDTAENLRNTILQCLDEYGRFGIFGKQNGKRKYGFIHGKCALDNSRHGKYCGVNNELEILRETGCYADFTFPVRNEANPSQINSIYYAKDETDRPKSYNRGTKVVRGGTETGDLMIIQGPIYPFSLFRCFTDSINGRPAVNKMRIDRWVSTRICVHGKRDFLFVKTHTHGAVDAHAVLGREMEDIFSYLETRYNDGEHYILHYVTAREAYNIIKAVESGACRSDPEPFRDYLISKPKYDSSPDIPEASALLRERLTKTRTNN